MFLFVVLIAVLGITHAAPTYNRDCSGYRCKHISMPLLDDMKATLKAHLDVSEMNKYLQEFIQQEVQTGIQTAMKYAMEEMVNNRTNAIQDRIQTFLREAKEQSEDTLARKLTEFESKFEQKDKKYAFFAYLSSAKSGLSSGTIIKFDKAPLNIGNSYHNTTGKFTCKQDGIYTFSWTVLSAAKKDFNSALVVDGTEMAYNIVDNDKLEDAMTGSSTVVVELKTGQSVWISAASNGGTPNKVLATFNSHTRITKFSGFMI